MESVTLTDLSSQKTLRDPISFYTHLREQEPLTSFTFGPIKRWVLAATYDEASELLKDPRLVKDARNVFTEGMPQQIQQFAQDYGEMVHLATNNMLMADPPDHTRLRSLVSKAFTPRMIEQLQPRIQQIADELLDAVQGHGQMDLVTDFAYLLPITVICEMLGIPSEERADFRAWTRVLLNNSYEPGQAAQIKAVGDTMLAYLRRLLAIKREHPGGDLISLLLQVEEQGDKLSENELLSMIWLLIIAGHETTTNLLSNGMLALFQHPDQLHLLQQDPSLISSAVEELLRFTAPVVFSDRRMAREDITLHSQVIHRGEVLYIALISADTDQGKFTNPETLDITRQQNHHLAFGKGIHACLGAPLARLEGQVAFRTLLSRLPNLRLACEPESLEWNPIFSLRSLKSLPVTF